MFEQFGQDDPLHCGAATHRTYALVAAKALFELMNRTAGWQEQGAEEEEGGGGLAAAAKRLAARCGVAARVLVA